ncbi:flavin reductase [Vulcanococcus sp.]|jgi:flavorubredoxin/flavin reductase (DIM6/NTAB) family NADH-FMN oxidoreductase RutF|uniref:flavin reductase n=1 Tax=Vulcanococcus sp. TaxID=2856995 RepID=UPI003C01B3A5
MAESSNDRRVIQLPLDAGLICLRGLSPKRLRFEVEYGLERGTSANSFLFLPGAANANGQSEQIGSSAALLVHPPGASFAEPYLEQLRQLVPANVELQVVVSHVNPNRVALLHQLARGWSKLRLIASNPGAKLLEDLWGQRKPSAPGEPEPEALPELPPITIVRGEDSIERPDGYSINLLSAPTPRWPGALMAFEETTGLLMSGKFFSAHLCSEAWAESNRSSTEEDRRYFYDCLMAPMARQVEAVLNRLDELPIRTIAPGHGPAIAESWRSLLVDYRRWGESQGRSNLSVALLFASAYGNTAAIADAIAQGVSRTGVRVESVNCEFTPAEKLLEAIRGCDALLIGSPTLGGHAPTPIVSALGTVLSEGDRSKPVGVFGSFGWSGEAIDLLESKLRDGGFNFAFEPIRVKFSPDAATIKTCEETGTGLGRSLINQQRKAQRRSSAAGGLSESRSNPAVQALGRVVGSLCVLTTEKGSGDSQLSGAMVASWVSQASFTPPGVTVAVAKDRAVEALLHVGDGFALNVLASGRESGPMKQFLQPFAPGADRFAGLELERSPNGQPILPEALAWLECSVKQRMECGDHWLIYAQVQSGALLDADGTTAVHQRRSGANY